MYLRRMTLGASVMAALLAAGLLTAGPGWAAFPGANGKIVFMVFGSTDTIHTVLADGSHDTTLTDPGQDNLDPHWSPDGQKIVFVSQRDGNQEIYVMNADGSAQTRLTTNTSPDNNPSWSPDGTKIVFASNRSGSPAQIFVMNADGSGQTALSTPAFGDSPVWSPDGTKIAFVGNTMSNFGINVMNPDGSGQTDLTSDLHDSNPDWSPNGSKIAFSHNAGIGLATEVYVMNADGTNPTDISNNAAADNAPAWSPDGSKIVFDRGFSGSDHDLFVMNPDGSAQTQLTSLATLLGFPDWQPLICTAHAAVSVLDTGYSPKSVKVSQCGMVTWTVSPADTQNHTVTDSSGMALFDSGTLAPGDSFAFAFSSAGSYGYHDALNTSLVGTVKVPIVASPSAGTTSTSFTITWAFAPPTAGYVDDIQILRPGATAWASWQKGQTGTSATFTPDGGVGTYSFRGRLRKSNGKHSGWSPKASISVS